MMDVRDSALAWLDQGKQVALATVIKTWGSAPRPTGSQMAVCEDGNFAGSVSGGCVESAVIEEALASFKNGKPKKLEFGVSDETAWSLGLPCGGKIEVFVEPRIKREILNVVVRAINLATGDYLLIDPDTDDSALGLLALDAARKDTSASVEIGGQSWFLAVHNPPLDLVIVGAVHIAQSLAQMALMADYRVRILDPRPGFANEARFPGVTLVQEWADEALKKQPLSRRSALVVLAHDPKIDDPALVAALKSPCFYIGALGSKKNQAARAARLKELGFDEAALARIRGPVGLSIGARSPAEIAISILAEITQVLRG